MWASVHFRWFYPLSNTPGPQTNPLSVSVMLHVLEESMMPEKLRWVWLIGCYSWGPQIALPYVDASLLGRQGGCAYFVYQNSEISFPEQVGVFRYNFIDRKTELIERRCLKNGTMRSARGSSPNKPLLKFRYNLLKTSQTDFSLLVSSFTYFIIATSK